jgi:ADP-ribosyl-[dinitrogen reductase] hydrolase
MNVSKDRIAGCLIGLACGDAVGTTLEFLPRGTIEPIEDMVGGGHFDLEKGQWTDDTSMALCLGHSLIFKHGFDPVDQMNRYCNWYHYGYMSSTGDCFDIGVTVSQALKNYLATGEAFSGSTEKYSSGNGALMRLAPIPMYYHRDIKSALHFAGESSRTTHGSNLCIQSSKLFCEMLLRAMKYETKDEVLNVIFKPESEEVQAIANGKYLEKSYEELTGSGFVIESLESALWCFYHGNTFKESILLAANIGNDADTTAAICGQIAGAFYGVEGIPINWVDQLTESKEIQLLAVQLSELGKREYNKQ